MLNIIVGGFYGDEGKGKIVGYLAVKDNPNIVVRAGGGPQAGHTITEGKKVTQVPGGFVNPNARLLIARGTVVNPEVVLREIAQYGVQDRIGIDFGCTVIEPQHLAEEQELVKKIGSVGTGTGPARVDRVLRKGKLAQDIPSLKPYLTDVADEVNTAIGEGNNILVEGVQGYGLSLLDYRFYPYVTSQDTTASQFAVDIGIGPKAVDEITIVYKAYVSRVAVGPMQNEWSDEEKQRRGIEERGTVSGRIRRLGDFDMELARESCERNTATQAAVTCADRLFKNNFQAREFDALTSEAKDFISRINTSLKGAWPQFLGITLISTGPDIEDMVDLRNK